jgi:hypothetical protein
MVGASHPAAARTCDYGRDYTKTIQLDPDHVEAYGHRKLHNFRIRILTAAV